MEIGSGQLMSKYRGSMVMRVLGLLLLVVALGGISLAAMPRVKDWLKPASPSAADNGAKAGFADLDPTQPWTIIVSADGAARLGIVTSNARKATISRSLQLSGSLAPDTDHLLPVRSRFAGEVVDIGPFADPNQAGPTRFRDVSNLDRVHAGQLLAVVWSKDLGEKKNELIDAILKRKLDQENLDNLEQLYRKGAVAERSLREAEFSLKSDRNAIAKAESTLRSWRLTNAEIEAVFADADRLAETLRKKERGRTGDDWQAWARVEVRAPFDGIILEKNIARGAIVDTTTNLFMIGDLSNLSVWAYAYEEDLPALLALPKPIAWKIHVKNEPGDRFTNGTVREIRPLIDPTIHAALVKGLVENRNGRLVAGQFITAVIDLPAALDELEIPTACLIEDGDESVVFVQTDKEKRRYQLRHVKITRRGHDVVHVRQEIPFVVEDKTVRGLKAGESVVAAGALEMRAALQDLQEVPAKPAK
jgi:cobalt-zinc-cadmium efflux system membrane fusion protein